MATKGELEKQKKSLEAEISALESNINFNTQNANADQRTLDSGRSPYGPLTPDYKQQLRSKVTKRRQQVKADEAALTTARSKLVNVKKQLAAL